MTQIHSNTKKRNYTHLTDIERGQIAAYIEQGLSQRKIAEIMGRNVSTISREIKRGSVQQINTHRNSFTKYFDGCWYRVYEENRRNSGSHSTIMKGWEFIEFVEEKILKDKWSPDAVVGYGESLKTLSIFPQRRYTICPAWHESLSYP